MLFTIQKVGAIKFLIQFAVSRVGRFLISYRKISSSLHVLKFDNHYKHTTQLKNY